MRTFQIKRHDLAPSVTLIAMDADGQLVDLTGYTLPRFLMRRRDAAGMAITRAAAIDDALQGRLRYDWQTGDTNVAGTYFAEFEVTDPQGRKRTFPAAGLIRVEVQADLDDA